MHFDFSKEEHILKWTIKKLVKKKKHLTSEANENTPGDLIKIGDSLPSWQQTLLFALTVTVNHKYFHWDLYRTISVVQ